MNRLHLASLFSVLVASGFACGGISDPTRNAENVATVSGALTGTTVPAGARVALVWRKASGGVEVGAEAPIVNGQFSMTLGTPPDAYFFATEGNDYEKLSGGSAAPPSTDPGVPEPAPAPAPAPPSGGGKLSTKTNVSGGITEPMKVAVAGFVVYVDANGNGKLDLQGEYAASPDTILGGNKELFLAYLKGGGQLDYEKLRDKSGILPASGYNLAWDEGRWLPLSLVELKLNDDAKLPNPVCYSYGGTPANSGSGGGSGGSSTGNVATPGNDPSPPPPSTDGGAPASYPSPTDPNLYCSPDGRSYSYGSCPPPPPPPVGLCAGDYGQALLPCAKEYNAFAGDTPPEGWPCPVPNTKPPVTDASAPPPADAGAD